MILRPLFEKLFKFREQASRHNRRRAGADEGFDPHEKPFLDHLEDLRKTLGKVITALVITTILGFAFHKQIFHFVLKPLEIASFPAEDGGGSLMDRLSFIVLSPPEILMLSIKVSFFAGLIGAFPLLVFFIGEFVMPGLRQQEKKLVVPGVAVGFFLFITGAAFAFYMATPIALKFFYQFQIDRVGLIKPDLPEEQQFMPIEIRRGGDDGTTIKATDLVEEGVDALEKDDSTTVAEEPPVHISTADKLPEEQRDSIRDFILELIVVEKGAGVQVYYDQEQGKVVVSTGDRKKIQYRIGEYISFVTRLVLVFGLSFQLPVVVTILVKLQLLTARVMRATRAFAWIIMLVLAAIFTPPDVFTLALLAGPLILLYEICIWIAWGIERKREKKRAEEEQAERLRLESLYSKSADELSEEEKEELHRREIEQYEREHEHLDHDHYDQDEHGDGHDDPNHPGLGSDSHTIGYDPHHDESWHEDHDDPYHNDPYHHPDHDHHPDDDHPHDPHEDAEAHQPIQDWPDREDGDAGEKDDKSDDEDATPDAEKKADESDSESASAGDGLESDHAEPSDGGGDSDADGDPDADHEVCEPTGALVNPNLATLEELITLPGVDEELADHMILYRPFNNFDELMEVPGMEEDILNGIIDRIVLE